MTVEKKQKVENKVQTTAEYRISKRVLEFLASRSQILVRMGRVDDLFHKIKERIFSAIEYISSEHLRKRRHKTSEVGAFAEVDEIAELLREIYEKLGGDPDRLGDIRNPWLVIDY